MTMNVVIFKNHDTLKQKLEVHINTLRYDKDSTIF